MKKACHERQPLFLLLCEMNQAVEWKLGHWYHVSRAYRAHWTDDLIRSATEEALAPPVLADDSDLEARLAALCSLGGVRIRVASAILALVYPEHYGVIDKRNWKALDLGDQPRPFRAEHYRRYLRELRRLAAELNAAQSPAESPWTVQGVDIALWHYAAPSNNR
jgi:hypothetical protein